MSVSLRVRKMKHPVRNLSTAKAILRQQIRESVVAPAAGETVEGVRLKECFESFQRKYDVDAESPWWKRLFFWHVYMPFVRFAFFRMRIVPMDHVNEKGELGWLERQAVWSERWRALQDAERYPFGGVERLSFNSAEEACTCAPRSQFPNSTARERYEECDAETIPIEQSALARLSRKVTETDAVVNRYRPKSA